MNEKGKTKQNKRDQKKTNLQVFQESLISSLE